MTCGDSRSYPGPLVNILLLILPTVLGKQYAIVLDSESGSILRVDLGNSAVERVWQAPKRPEGNFLKGLCVVDDIVRRRSQCSAGWAAAIQYAGISCYCILARPAHLAPPLLPRRPFSALAPPWRVPPGPIPRSPAS